MKSYTVYTKMGRHSPDEILFIREGFSWAAFLFNFFWALYHRLWLAASLIFLFNLAISVLEVQHVLSSEQIFIINVIFLIFVGIQGNDIRRHALIKRGYILTDIVCSDSEESAKHRFFSHYMSGPQNVTS